MQNHCHGIGFARYWNNFISCALVPSNCCLSYMIWFIFFCECLGQKIRQSWAMIFNQSQEEMVSNRKKHLREFDTILSSNSKTKQEVHNNRQTHGKAEGKWIPNTEIEKPKFKFRTTKVTSPRLQEQKPIESLNQTVVKVTTKPYFKWVKFYINANLKIASCH